MEIRSAIVVESRSTVGVALRDLVRNTGATNVVVFGSWIGTERVLEEEPPSVLLISARLGLPPAHAALEAARERGTRIVVLVESEDPAQVITATRIPAHGFLDENDLTAATFLDAVDRIAAGGRPMPPAMTQQLVDLTASQALPRLAPALTVREFTVLELMAAGLSNKCIAQQLSISAHGVKRHVANILAKLNSANRTVAVMTAIETGLLPTPTASRAERRQSAVV